MKKRLLGWAQRIGADVIRKKHLFFVVTPAGKNVLPPEIQEQPQKLDRVLERSLLLKDSQTTTAGVAAVMQDNKPVFLKRCNNKGLKFTLRYLFRPSRVFRAAMSATRFAELGLPTPGVLMAGERRVGFILKAGYLVTESEPDIKPVSHLFEETTVPEELLHSFLPAAAHAVALLHRNKIIHGDLKVINWYYIGHWSPDSQYGIWDLDSVRAYPKELPHGKVVKELSRIVSSIRMFTRKNPLYPCGFTTRGIAEQLVSLYSAENPGTAVTAEEVISIAEERLERAQKEKTVHEDRKK